MQMKFQDIWEEQLSNEQKQWYLAQFQTTETVIDRLAASPIRLKYKKDGGFVATVFLQNGFPSGCLIDRLSVTVLDEVGEVVAREDLPVNETLPSSTAMPWSFVFSPEFVKRRGLPNDRWQVEIK